MHKNSQNLTVIFFSLSQMSSPKTQASTKIRTLRSRSENYSMSVGARWATWNFKNRYNLLPTNRWNKNYFHHFLNCVLSYWSISNIKKIYFFIRHMLQRSKSSELWSSNKKNQFPVSFHPWIHVVWPTKLQNLPKP